MPSHLRYHLILRRSFVWIFCWVIALLFVLMAWQLSTRLFSHLNESQYQRIAKNAIEGRELLRAESGALPPTKTVSYSSSHWSTVPVGTLRINPQLLSEQLDGVEQIQAQVLAVLLKQLRTAEVEGVILSTPWEPLSEGENMGQFALILELKQFSQHALGLRAALKASPENLLPSLTPYRIPEENCLGDIDQLPAANTLFPHLGQLGMDCPVSVDWVLEESLFSSVEEGYSFPLFFRWQGEVYPTLPLFYYMRLKQLNSDDVKLQLGKKLILGDKEWPLDSKGRIALTHAEVKDYSLSDLMNTEQSRMEGVPRHFVVEHELARAEKEPKVLANKAATLSLLLGSRQQNDDVMEVLDTRYFFLSDLSGLDYTFAAYGAALLFLLLWRLLRRRSLLTIAIVGGLLLLSLELFARLFITRGFFFDISAAGGVVVIFMMLCCGRKIFAS